MSKFVLTYLQPRRTLFSGELIREERKHLIEAQDLKVARRDADLFLQQGWLQFTEEESYPRKEISLVELSAEEIAALPRSSAYEESPQT